MDASAVDLAELAWKHICIGLVIGGLLGTGICSCFWLSWVLDLKIDIANLKTERARWKRLLKNIVLGWVVVRPVKNDGAVTDIDDDVPLFFNLGK